MSGILITFEGTEGAGKSTLIQALERKLKRLKIDVLITREPGGSPLAEKIRDILLHQRMDRLTELFLYEASRAEHLARTIRPALKKNKIILCDRFADSSLAYQGSARGIPWKTVQEANRLATQGLTPSLTVLLDIDPAFGLKRARDRNRFEDEGVRFQIKVRNGFLKASRQEPKRWVRLKVNKSDAETLAEKVLCEIQSRFPQRFKRKSSPKKKRTLR